MTFQNIPISITGFTLQRLLRFLPAKTYSFHCLPKNAYIYSPDQKRTHLYLLQKGRVKEGIQIDKNQQHVHHIVWEGELLGELALLGQSPPNGFAQALDAVEYYKIEAEAMRELFTQNWMAQMQFFQAFNKRLKASEARLFAQQTQDTRTRIVTFLLSLSKERGSRVGKYGYFVSPFFKQIDIAALTGCSLPAVGLVMRELKKEKLISYSSQQFRIYNEHELKYRIRL